MQSYAGHAHEVLDIAVSADNARFVSVGGDKQVLLWDVSEARVLRRFDGHSGRINACAWGGDGREEGVIISGEYMHLLYLEGAIARQLAKWFFIGSFDTTVKIWDIKSNSSKPLMTLSEAKDSVSCIAVVGYEIFVGSVDGRVRVYDIRMGKISIDVIGSTSLQPP